jgi:hypothetical protein
MWQSAPWRTTVLCSYRPENEAASRSDFVGLLIYFASAKIAKNPTRLAE